MGLEVKIVLATLQPIFYSSFSDVFLIHTHCFSLTASVKTVIKSALYRFISSFSLILYDTFSLNV